ncbi:1562_t:CDS:2 [Entrophospora sp. SA101]|nr:1562_t:CDS:2 [Entrophospora sp. SA101]
MEMGVFLFCKVRVTSSQSAICPLPRRITGYNSLVTTPSPLFRRSNFVVDKGLQIPEERNDRKIIVDIVKRQSGNEYDNDKTNETEPTVTDTEATKVSEE